ncbi:hypothetical protein Bca4012_051322 [Brassica carinata]
MPLWIDLKGVPNALFSQKSLKCLTTAVEKFVKLLPHTERCTRLDIAHDLSEVNLHEPLVEKIEFRDNDGMKCEIVVKYPWLPPRCTVCKGWGRKGSECRAAGVSILQRSAEAEVVADAGLVVDLAVKSGMVVVQTGAQGVMGQGGNVVSDLLRELAALPIGSHLQVEKQTVQVEGVTSPRLTISDPITESFIDSEESGLGLVSGKAHSSHTAQRTEQGSTSVPHRDGGLNIDVSPSRLSRLLEVDEDDDEVLEDAISEVEETEDGELIEDKATLPKQENGRGRRAAGANSHKSAKKTIVRAKDLKFGGKQGQLKRSSLGKL